LGSYDTTDQNGFHEHFVQKPLFSLFIGGGGKSFGGGISVGGLQPPVHALANTKEVVICKICKHGRMKIKPNYLMKKKRNIM